MRLAGKNILITGGGSGIGEAVVRRFVAEGAAVTIVDIDSARAEAVAAAAQGETHVVACDVRNEAQVRNACDAALERWGHIDVLVNNAGSELNAPYDTMSEDQWDMVQNTDLKGPWLFCKHLVPSMVARGQGSVINVASLNGLVGFPLSTAYGAAKGGLVVFTKDMAIELAQSGVRFNCVCPGVIKTPMMERWTNKMPDQDEAQEMLRNTMPIGRMGTADEVAGAILFFASDDSTLCQGAVLSVDGGFTAQ